MKNCEVTIGSKVSSIVGTGHRRVELPRLKGKTIVLS